jgi:hypothetical protein
MAKRARMDSPVKITKPVGLNRNYKNELGTIFDIKTEGRHTYYMVRLNGGHQISVGRDEITVL